MPLKTKKISFTIGADPEFAIYRRLANGASRVICAGDMLADRYRLRDKLGGGLCDQGGKSVFDLNQMGEDGSGSPCELRPSPTKDPLELVHEIAKILRDAVMGSEQMYRAEWVAGSWGRSMSLGGHIHFGVKYNYTVHAQVVERTRVLKALDEYLGVPLMLIEGVKEGTNRRTRYGYASDFRDQPWGLEYRTPGSWLVSPYVASAVLCLAKAVMHETQLDEKLGNVVTSVGEMENKCRDYGAYGCKWVTHMETISCINSSNHAWAYKIWPDLWARIQKMVLYHTYRQYIDMIQFLIDNKLSWYPNVSMKQAWGIPCDLFPVPDRVSAKDLWKQ